ncbi:MAG: hypothetical protein ACPGGK_09415 [Pikeienuella sp.]
MKWLSICAVLLATAPIAAIAGVADVVAVKASQSNGQWRFDVTVDHADTGWDHYANIWRVVGADGTVYGERVLAHPHVNERPFTRSLGGVNIPAGVSEVWVEAGDSEHGFGGLRMKVTLGE